MNSSSTERTPQTTSIFGRSTMKEVFRFIFSKRFPLHLLLAGASLIIILFLAFAWMSNYTEHGDTQPVPDLVNMDVSEAQRLIEQENLRLEVEDSVFVEDAVPGTVVSQNPPATYLDPKDSTVQLNMVKSQRKVYVSIASYLPPKVEVPDLVGKSKRSALNLLEIIGLRVGQMRYEPDQVCTDCVLEQLYDGQPIAPGTRLFKGESIVLVLGRKDAQYVSIPKIEGFTYAEAQNILNRVSLNLGGVIGGCDECETKRDTMESFVLRQLPAWGSSTSLGTPIEVHLTQDPSLLEKESNP